MRLHLHHPPRENKHVSRINGQEGFKYAKLSILSSSPKPNKELLRANHCNTKLNLGHKARSTALTCSPITLSLSPLFLSAAAPHRHCIPPRTL